MKIKKLFFILLLLLISYLTVGFSLSLLSKFLYNPVVNCKMEFKKLLEKEDLIDFCSQFEEN